jgi:DNA-binding beta-propeller fold protein YncE
MPTPLERQAGIGWNPAKGVPMKRAGARRSAGLVVAVLFLSLTAVGRASIPEDTAQWVALYDGQTSDGGDTATSLAMSPDGSKVFVTGHSSKWGDEFGLSDDYSTVAYSAASGSELWVARYNGPADFDDVATSLVVSPDGSKVFVTGRSYDSSSGSSYDYATVAYSAASGSELWVARSDGPANKVTRHARYIGPTYNYDFAHSLAVSPDGTKVFVTGEAYDSGGSPDYATVAYSASSGSELWVARYDGSANLIDFATSLAVSPDGSMVFVTGESDHSSSSQDFATVAYSASSGSELWVARYDGSANSANGATALAFSPDGSKVFVTGYSADSGGVSAYATAAYSTLSGSELWVALYGGPENSHGGATSLAVSPDGSKIFVTGYSWDATAAFADYATVAYSALNGSEIWRTRYDGPGSFDDFAYSLAVSPDGSKVFVTGESRPDPVVLGNGWPDFATLAYSTLNGSQLWLARYDGAANQSDIATSLAVSPDGARVFVTGDVYEPGSSTSYATVAYLTTACSNGKDEVGSVSGPANGTVEPRTGRLTPYVHGAVCDVVTSNGM